MQQLRDLLAKAELYKQKRINCNTLSADERNALEEYGRINFVYSSNALDGSLLTIAETKNFLKDGLTAFCRHIKDYYQAGGLSDACSFLFEVSAKKETELSKDMIKNLHRFIYRRTDPESAGIYRTKRLFLPESNEIPPLPEDIERLMDHLVNQIHSSKTTLHPVELAAMALKRLTDIRPFMYGNESVARLLMNFVLLRSGYGIVCIPPEKKEEYLSALDLSRINKDMEPFSEFIAGCVLQSEKNYCHILNLA